MKKDLCITSDIFSDIVLSDSKLGEGQIDGIMQYAASLGATRFEWVLYAGMNLYEEHSPLGYDLMRVACDAAHRHGMRFDAVYKPFETGPISPIMSVPHSFPHSSDDRVIRNENGLLHSIDRFAARNLDCRIARRKGDGEDPGGRLAEIRLVKLGTEELQFRPEDISFWHSATNGNFQRFEGKLETSVSQSWRLSYPYDDKLSTVIHFKGFDLPETSKYLEVRCSKLSQAGSFSNAIEKLVELVNERGENIPCAPSTIHPSPAAMYRRAKLLSDLGVVDYLAKPDVQALLESFETFDAHFEANCKGMYWFEPQWETLTLDREGAGAIAVCRGKPLSHPTCLHPIYPEVRQNWLATVQYCIDRGVDGVNIRISRHASMNEPWAYGFNDPVIEQLKNKDDVYEAALVNGQAFDTFLEDAAALLHRHNREIGVHLCGMILRAPDRKMGTTKPSNFVWNWEKWVHDLVDYTEFHKTNFFTFPHAKEIVDHFSHVVHQTGKPFIYQSGQSAGVTHFDGPYHFLPFEMQWAKNHPHITCYNLYETASFFQLDEQSRYVGSPHMARLVKENWS